MRVLRRSNKVRYFIPRKFVKESFTHPRKNDSSEWCNAGKVVLIYARNIVVHEKFVSSIGFALRGQTRGRISGRGRGSQEEMRGSWAAVVEPAL
jgi:hypothetical protein